MPISGLVIELDPAVRESVVAELQAIPSLELTDTPADAALVAVLDVPSIRDEEDLFKQINDLPGVRKVSLSYHNFEDLNS